MPNPSDDGDSKHLWNLRLCLPEYATQVFRKHLYLKTINFLILLASELYSEK